MYRISLLSLLAVCFLLVSGCQSSSSVPAASPAPSDVVSSDPAPSEPASSEPPAVPSPAPVSQEAVSIVEAALCPGCGHTSMLTVSLSYEPYQAEFRQICAHGCPSGNDMTIDRYGLRTDACSICGYEAETEISEHFIYCAPQERYYLNRLLPDA